MSTFTSAQVGVFPTRLITSLTLGQIASALVLKRPHHASLSSGWGGPVTTNSLLGMLNTAPPVSDPILIPATAQYPERLHARYYTFITDAQLQEIYAAGTDQEQHRLSAIDVLISRESGSSNTYLVLISSSNSAVAAAGPYASLVQQVVGADPSARSTFSSSALDLGSADVFLWLLCRRRDNAALDADTRIDRIERLAGMDASKRLTALTKGVDFDRPSFLVAVAEIDELGPARLKLVDKPLKARFMFDLGANGSFKIITSQSGYRSRPNDELMRWDAVHDLAFNLIPKVKRIYEADGAWSTTTRDDEIRKAVEALITRYRAKLPGPPTP